MSFKTFVFPEDVEGVQLDDECMLTSYVMTVQRSKEAFIQRLGNGCLYAEEFLAIAFNQIKEVLEDENKGAMEMIFEVKAIVDVARAAVDKADERQAHFEKVLHAITNGAVSVRKESDDE